MSFLFVGVALLLHCGVWGLGLAWWATPSRWRCVWPLWIPLAGWVLQSAVVWTGSYLNLAGTNSYAWASLALPLFLALTAGHRAGWGKLLADMWANRGPLGGMVAAALVLLLPMALASHRLTTFSLSSCDAADYAAGTRVFMEFVRSDRTGLLGLTEVVSVASTDNFFDFWLRLNHFTPSAIAALNATVFKLSIHEIIGVLTVAFWASILPAAYFFARVGLRLGGWGSAAVAVAATFSPVSLYAVVQVAMAQLLATVAIAFLTTVGLLLWRHPREARANLWLPALLLIYSLLLGAYNFILLVAWTPAAAVVGWELCRDGGWRRVLPWGVAFGLPLLGASIFWWDRAEGVVERFQLFQAVDFGWKIPVVSPEGWLGGVGGADLTPLTLGPRLGLGLVLVGVTAWAAIRGGRSKAALLLLLSLPVLSGYTFLQVRGLWLGTHASYDAYKILSVFLPLLVGFAGLVIDWRKGEGRLIPAAAALGLVFLLSVGTSRAWGVLRQAPFSVTPDTAALREIETRADVSGINLRVDDFWTRLWANAFLLRKEQFFLTHTYEGRRPTNLRGSHDLQASPLCARVRGGWHSPEGQFALTPAGATVVSWGKGWYDQEQSRRDERIWRWSPQVGTWDVQAAQGGPTAVEFEVRALTPRTLRLIVNGAPVASINVASGSFQRFRLDDLILPAGRSEWRLESEVEPQQPPGGQDARGLGFAVSLFVLERS